VKASTARFLDGLATGVVVCACALLAYLAEQMPEYRGMLEAFGGELPALTRLVIAPGFVGSIAAGSIMFALLLNVTGKRFGRTRTFLLAGIAVVAV
jgi:type II secretory pathway component PulF